MTLKLSNKSNILGTRIWNNNDDGTTTTKVVGRREGHSGDRYRYRYQEPYLLYFLLEEWVRAELARF